MPASNPDPEELTSWKEIAAYLRVSVRTAQNWERERGLPVRRFAGERGRVSATAEALAQWRLSRREGPVNPSRWRRYGVLAAALVLVLSGVAAFVSRRGPPAAFRVEFRTLVVTDVQGHELWRHQLDDPPNLSAEESLRGGHVWFGDLDGDGHTEFLYAYTPVPLETHGSTLFCFSDTGREKWRFIPGRRVSTRSEVFSPPFLIFHFKVAPAADGRTKTVLLTSHHMAFFPTQVVALSSSGKVLGEYWHSGFLTHAQLADLDGDGAGELLLAGISNGYRAATLVVLDPRNLGGASAEENTDYQLQGFGPGREKARIVFPRTCINRKFEQYNRVRGFAVEGDAMHVTIWEKMPDVLVDVIYYLNRNLELTTLDVNDGFRDLHRQLFAARQLDHPLTGQEIAELRRIRVLKPMPARAR